MDLGFEGKVAMVAAASQGIGLATAKLLAAEGARVSICGRSEAKLRAAAEEIPGRVLTVVADVSDEAALARWYETTRSELGTPEIVVTNTGGPPAGSWTEMTDAQWRDGLDSTLLNVVRLMRLASPAMIEGGWGRIVHVTSLVAKDPNSLLPISSTIRAGLIALTKLHHRELAPHGITVNAVLPGNTLTGRQRHLAEIRAEREGISVDEALDRSGRAVPVGRLGEPEEIAAAIGFLCSKPAAYVGGVSLLVDGGVSNGLG